MTHFFRRMLAALLCLCLLGGLAPSLAEEGAKEYPENYYDGLTPEQIAEIEEREKKIQLVDRFGFPESIEFDDAGEPITVNGFPTKQVRAGFNNLGQKESFQTVVDFVDYPFWRPATQFDGNLAALSLVMAGCANRAVGFLGVPAEDFDPSLNVVHFFTDAGFTDIRRDDYSKVPTMFTVSTAMGHREMTHEGEEPFTLIAIGVCGEGYKNEWESNMTAGNGEIHEGFQSAAQLVIDRLAGYIATRGIQGRVKVWISGFSRAAAVSNVVAGTLVNTGFLPKEDVYAYTFATPAAIRNPPQEGYENIFNIINPADLVPQVMPAEWGYGRYGTDLFLPVQEFSSFGGYIESIIRNSTNKEKYNVEYNYSPMLTLRLRLLMSLVLELTEDVENYNARFQPALVGLLHNNAISSRIATLQSLMMNIQLVDREDKTHLDDLVDYFMRVFSGILMRSGYQDADNNTGSAMFRLMIEHTPNSYLAALGDMRYGADFRTEGRCCYVMVKGPVSVTMRDDENDLDVFTVSADGQATYTETYDFANLGGSLFYSERSGDTTVIGVPLDADYTVTWTAEKDGTVECRQAIASLKASSAYPGAGTGKMHVKAGDTGTAFVGREKESLSLEGFSDTVYSAMDLAGFMNIVSLGVNWRIALTVMFALPALLVCLLLCMAAGRKKENGKKHSFFTWAALCLLGVAVLETEVAFWFFADQTWVRAVWKAIAALCFLAVFILTHRKENLLHSLFPFLLTAVVADVVITFHFISGLCLFLLAHVLLSVQFLRSAPMSLGKWIQWALVSAVLSAMIIFFYVPSHGLIGWGVAVYAPVLLLMTFSSGAQPIRLRAGAMMFLLSDLLLGMYATLLNEPIVHVVYMVLFYVALLVVAISPTRSEEAALDQKD